MTLLIASIALSASFMQGETKVQGDLRIATFDLPQGKITVYLPDDMMAGDTISGTVLPTPKGDGRIAEQNGATLTGYVVTVEGSRPKRSSGPPTWAIPAGVAAVTIAVTKPDGGVVATASCPVTPPGYLDNPSKFETDPINMAAAPNQIRGPFDGDSGNTKVGIGGEPATIVAETPRSCVAMGAPAKPGPTTIVVADNDQQASLPCNLVQIQMSIPKQTLMSGEKTTLTVQVSGLQGVAASEYPIPCEITNQTPSIVRIESLAATPMPGGQAFAFGVQPNMVRNGVANLSIGLVGVHPGQFLLKGVLFNVKIHDVKKKMNVGTFNAWVRGLIAGYEAKIKELEKEEAASPSAGRRINIDRKKKILGVLRSFSRATNNDLSVAKIAVDKVLADDAFFAMAAELITTATDMLGYTDVPMPGIGQIVKGLKALAGAAKLAKALEALEAAEKLTDAYEKLTDAKEKAEMLGKVKEALDNVKKALDAGE